MPDRIPRHVGFIPDGNRRWAARSGMAKHEGYGHGVAPGLALYEKCLGAGIEEISIYGFTKDNVRRPSVQKTAFTAASLAFAQQMIDRDAALLVVGDERGSAFPPQMAPYRTRRGSGIKVNLLLNYDWQWDLEGLKNGGLRSGDISRLDLIVRWGGGRRLSGFLPVQSVYADIYVEEALWPDFEPVHFDRALAWYARQDRTLGG